MMHPVTYRAPTACPDTVRQAHPDALIVRELAQGGYVTFRTADDARGHPTGQPVEDGTITTSGRHIPAAEARRIAA
jgi:hypothetical protein